MPSSFQPRGRAGLHRHFFPRRIAHAGRTGEREQIASLGADGRGPRSQGRCHAAVSEAYGESLRQKSPAPKRSHREWQQAAQRWAELVVLRWEWDESLEAADRTAWGELQATVEDAFGQWMMQRYGSLHNLPYHQQPVMVHQIPRFMAVERARKKITKIALLVLDGLAFDQWLLLKKNLEACDKAWRFRESTAFAWVPTLTSVTRQSIFAGEPPLYFPDSSGNDIEGESPLAAVLGGPGCSANRCRSGHEPRRPQRPEAGGAVGQSPTVSPGDRVEQDRRHHARNADADRRNAQPSAPVGFAGPFATTALSASARGLPRLPDRRPRQCYRYWHRQS